MKLTYRDGIYRPQGKGLGDCLMDLNYFSKLGLEDNKITRLALWYQTHYRPKKWIRKLKELLPLLKYNEFIELVDSASTVPKIEWTLGWKYPLLPTKITWEPNASRKICYQFDAKSKKDGRFPSAEIEDVVLQHARDLGYTVSKLSNTKTIKECVVELANCELLLGVCSGMTHLAAAVGTPNLYTQNNRPIKLSCNHANKHFVLACDYIELMKNMDRYNRIGLKYYCNHARNIELFKYNG